MIGKEGIQNCGYVFLVSILSAWWSAYIEQEKYLQGGDLETYSFGDCIKYPTRHPPQGVLVCCIFWGTLAPSIMAEHGYHCGCLTGWMLSPTCNAWMHLVLGTT